MLDVSRYIAKNNQDQIFPLYEEYDLIRENVIGKILLYYSPEVNKLLADKDVDKTLLQDAIAELQKTKPFISNDRIDFFAKRILNTPKILRGLEYGKIKDYLSDETQPVDPII